MINNMLDQTIQFFTIQKEIGRGGMAIVYLAKNNIGKKVAIKVLNKEYFYNDQAKKRFVQEAKLMVQMEHENICSVISLEDNDEFSAIIMEYLEGQDLKSYINKYKAVPEATVMNWLEQIAPALDYAHGKDIVHRDIKPSNFLLTSKKDQIKLMDFGIAKVKNSMISTHTNMTLGTEVYMSPEQLKSSKHVDNKTDIYSLGVTLYHLLSGKIPYDITNPSPFTVMTKITEEALPLLNNVSERMNAIIQTATQKDKKDRPNTVSDLLKVGASKSHGKLTRVKKDGKYGFTDENDNTKIPLIYDDVEFFSEGLAVVKRNDKYGFIDKNGNTKIPLIYDEAEYFSEGLAEVKKNGKWGFIDKNGNTKIPFNYNTAYPFSEGLARVKKKIKWGFIDKNGTTKIPFNYDRAWSFKEGLACVEKDGKWGWIDKNGNTKIPLIYDFTWVFFRRISVG